MFKNGVSIRTKIIITPILLVAMISVFIYNYYPAQQKQQAINDIQSKIKSIDNMFSIGVGIGMGETDLVAVSEALNWAQGDSSIIYISVSDKKTEILTYNPKNVKVPEQLLSAKENNRSFEAKRIIYYRSNIIYQNHFCGSLIIGYSLKALENKIARLRKTTLYFCMIFFLLGGVFSIITSFRITNNIRKLDFAVKEISEGNQQMKLEINSNDEVGKLATAFNQMVHNINKSRDELIVHSMQLQKQNQELNQFSYVVSHDLKAPLRAIFKLSEWIEEDLGTNVPEQMRNNMQTLRGRIFRLEALINGLLEYSKIGRINIKDEKVDIDLLLKEIIDLLNPPANFMINIPVRRLVFETKKILLQQVFFNLLLNAIKYSDKPVGEINITMNTGAKFYEFVVEDNGIGIDPNYHEKVFIMFQTLEARDKVEGTGIGLAIIKKSVEDMGGTISLQSELGKGSRFSFTWPKKSI